MTPLLFWLAEFIIPTISVEWYEDHGPRLSLIIVSLIIILQTIRPTNRFKAGLFLIAIYAAYREIEQGAFYVWDTLIIGRIFEGPPLPWVYIVTSIFASLALWVAFRPKVVTRTLNRENVIMAFYRGSGGKFKMKVAELFGLPLKSFALIAGEDCLRPKDGELVLSKSADAMIKSGNYYFLDTGVPITDSILNDMKYYDKVPVKSGFFRCDCIRTIEPLLAKLGDRFVPRGFLGALPGIYAGRVR